MSKMKNSYQMYVTSRAHLRSHLKLHGIDHLGPDGRRGVSHISSHTVQSQDPTNPLHDRSHFHRVPREPGTPEYHRTWQ